MIFFKDLKIDKIQEFNSLTSSYHQVFGIVFNDNIRNSTFMIDYLDSFIRTFRNYDYERALLDYLDSSVGGSKTLIHLLIEYLQHNQQENSSKIKSSTNKKVHEFYIYLMLAVGKGQSLLELCYKVKDFYSGGK